MSQDWQSDTSALYRRLAGIAVPHRAEQIAVLLALIPFAPTDKFRVVELASGEGYLSQAVAEAFPQASILALDYEESMREATQARLGARGTVAAFDIRADDWFAHLDGADVVVSSLCVHHLDTAGKRRLFAEAQARLAARGALLIADLIAPTVPGANRVYAATWDQTALTASFAQTQSRQLFDLFQREEWNLFHHPDPDFDKPSPLFDQLRWLGDAGFSVTDCFWMQAGHAIYGGFKAVHDAGIAYVDARAIAQHVLQS